MMRRIYIVSVSFITALFLSACGNGNSLDSSKTPRDIVDCNSTTVITDYTQMYSNDTIINDEDNTTISTYHDTSGNKYVCTQTGKAHLE
jgi:hypothetical protein